MISIDHFNFLCHYCNHEFKKYKYNLRTNEKKCPRCGDTNISEVTPKEEIKDVFGYDQDKKDSEEKESFLDWE